MRQRIVGMVDAVVAGAVAGWARDRRSTTPVTVTVLHEGRAIDWLTSDRARPDLDDALAAHGFVFVVPPDLDGAAAAGLSFVAEDGTVLSIADGVDLDVALGFDPAFVATLGLEAPFLRGGVDADTGGAITGFAYSLLRRAPVTVELLLGGIAVAAATADGDRPDLAALGRRPSGFVLQPPPALFDGTGREMAVRVAGTDFVLPGSARVAAFRPLVAEVLRQRAGWIAGSLLPAAAVAAPEAVLVEIDGTAVAAAPLHAGRGGRLVFSFRLPASACDGDEHRVAVRYGEAGYRVGSAGGADALAVRRPVRGFVVGVAGGVLTGWAVDARTPDEPVAIEVFDGTRRVAGGRADRDRGEAVAPGTPRAAGFAIPLPVALFDAPRLLTVAANGETLTPPDRAEVAVEIGPADRPTGGHRFAGAVTAASHAGVAGFAVDRASDRPPTLAVTVDGELVATVVADRPLADLGIEAEPPAGSPVDCGFHLAIPPCLLDGRAREVAVTVVGDGLRLPGSDEAVAFPVVWLTEGAAGSAAPPVPAVRPVPLPSGQRAGAPGASGRRLAVPLTVLARTADGLADRLAALVSHAGGRVGEIVVVGPTAVLATLGDGADGVRRLPVAPGHSLFEALDTLVDDAGNDAVALLIDGFALVGDALGALQDALAAESGLAVVGARIDVRRRSGDGPGAWRTETIGATLVPDPDEPRPDRGYRTAPIAPGDGASGSEADGGLVDVAAVSPGLVLFRTAALRAAGGVPAGGVPAGYAGDTGLADLCLAIARSGSGRVACHTGAVVRRVAAAVPQPPDAAAADRRLFARRHPALAAAVVADLLAGGRTLAHRPLRVAFGVTSADPRTPAGDYFTAMELGLALKEVHGFEVVFADLKARDLAGADVFVVMRHDFPAGEMAGGAPGLVTVAWVRNRVDEWLENGALDRCALIFASAGKAAEAIRAATGRPVTILPIAANTRRFSPTEPSAEHAADLSFTGHFWGDEREAVGQLDPATLDARFAIYGHGWDEDPAFAPFWRGPVPYQELPRVYGSAKLVIDDSHPVTRVWDSLNSRVFDATAAGALVLTNCTGGVAEQFGGRLPSFSTSEELRSLVARYLADDGERERLAAALRADVLARHDYRNRAATLVETLKTIPGTLRIAIKSPVPKASERAAWGDHHFALALKRALQRAGAIVRIDDLPDWYGGTTAGDDVVIALRGLSRYRPSPGALNLMWLISHPDEASLAELQGYDHVFVASKPYAGKLRTRLGDRVSALLQATDPDLFRPISPAERAAGPAAGALLFVGNTRGQRRVMVDRVEAAGHRVRVAGQGWTGIIPDDRIAGTHVANDQVSAHYASADVVLNDHWPDMAAEGFLSNRLFDAAAAGAAILSDPAAGLEDVFGDLVATAATPEEADAAIRRLGSDRRRAARAKALRALVLEHHTFDHRAAAILATIADLRR